MRRFASLIGSALLLTACGISLDRDNPPVTTHLTVFNRTLDEVTLTDAAGRRLVVAPCEEAVAPAFRMEMVQISTEDGNVSGFGGGGGGASRPQFMVITRDVENSVPRMDRPSRLPACDGHLEAQPRR
ncbi:MAG: hypothetical protein ABR509_08620 [Candidatus Limnocylindria bacterium]